MRTVLILQVVLANGSVEKITPSDSFADLFWALRGGGNSLALVTDLELKAYAVPVVTVGITAHDNSTTSSRYYDKLADFILHGQSTDEKASVIPVINSGSTAQHAGAVSYTTYRFWEATHPMPLTADHHRRCRTLKAGTGCSLRHFCAQDNAWLVRRDCAIVLQDQGPETAILHTRDFASNRQGRHRRRS